MKLKPHPVTYNGQPIGADEFAFEQPAGGVRGVAFWCRGANINRPRICLIPIRHGEPENGVFGWDGNLDDPTIKPSIGCDQRCGWHGHIIEGEISP